MDRRSFLKLVGIGIALAAWPYGKGLSFDEPLPDELLPTIVPLGDFSNVYLPLVYNAKVFKDELQTYQARLSFPVSFPMEL